jgi:hypothetical protein
MADTKHTMSIDIKIRSNGLYVINDFIKLIDALEAALEQSGVLRGDHERGDEIEVAKFLVKETGDELYKCRHCGKEYPGPNGFRNCECPL